MDPILLEQMLEPLQIHITKAASAGERESVLMLSNLNKDFIRRIEVWLVNEYSGGGFYSIWVEDSSIPNKFMMWSCFYDLHFFPNKKPNSRIETIKPIEPETEPPDWMKPSF